MTEGSPKRLRYWVRHVDGEGNWREHPVTGVRAAPPGQDLALFRAGLAREPGAVHGMWNFISAPVDDRLAQRDQMTVLQRAEFRALALYGMHQQSQTSPMHRSGTSMGSALRTLRAGDRYRRDPDEPQGPDVQPNSLDDQVGAAVESTTVTAFRTRVEGLLTQLQGIGEPVDYDVLLDDLVRFESADGRDQVRRRWGLDYLGWKPDSGQRKRPRYWIRYMAGDDAWRRDPATGLPKPPPGEELALCRSGPAREPGTVFRLWRFISTPVDDWSARRGEMTALQRAEFRALALYGMHQQSQTSSMHRRGASMGSALMALRAGDRYRTNPESLDDQVNAAVGSTTVTAFRIRLEGLVTQLRGIGEPVDYDGLLYDLLRFESADGRDRVRRRWGLDYLARKTGV
ncbi:type I-E CRISPR-associated protein Cse2/CasB [Embleya sp. AB8]|uniref:type I-E CRISPR-associated protein Cse2/CasB n=1 Tax=Embleya sp. AB8 TaxID=3156304 RepID=UPI003C76F54C